MTTYEVGDKVRIKKITGNVSMEVYDIMKIYSDGVVSLKNEENGKLKNVQLTSLRMAQPKNYV